MKAILEFDLDNPDDNMSHKRCVKSADMACFIWELKHNFLRRWKHGDIEFNLEMYKEALNHLLEDHNIDIDDLIE